MCPVRDVYYDIQWKLSRNFNPLQSFEQLRFKKSVFKCITFEIVTKIFSGVPFINFCSVSFEVNNDSLAWTFVLFKQINSFFLLKHLLFFFIKKTRSNLFCVSRMWNNSKLMIIWVKCSFLSAKLTLKRNKITPILKN